MNKVSIICVPSGFKIKKKLDADYFVNKCMQNNNEYYLKINKELAIFLKKEKDGSAAVLEKRGDLYDVFNPLLEVANTSNSSYRETVQDCIWKYRKYINAKWFND